MRTALEQIKTLLRGFFVQQDLNIALSTLNQNIYAYGFADDIVIEGIDQAKELLDSVNYHEYSTYELAFLDERSMDHSCAELGFSLSHNEIQVQYRVTAVSRNEDGEERLSLLHFSIISSEHKPSLFHDLYHMHEKQEEYNRFLVDAQNMTSVVIKQGHLGLWIYDIDDRKVEQIFAQKGAYGYDLIAANIPESYIKEGVIHKEDAENYRKCYQDIIDGGNISECRARVFDKERGAYFWTRICLVRQENTRDGRRRATGIAIDIDTEVCNYMKLQKEEQLMETACRLVNIWMFQYDLQNRSIYISKNLQEDYQVPDVVEHFPENFLKYPVIPVENHKQFLEMIRKVEAGEDATTEMQVRKANGVLCWVRFEWYITRQVAEEVVEVAGMVIDITHEIIERSRMDKERQKMLGGDKKLTAYSITDLQKEMIIEANDYYLGSGITGGDTCEEFIAKLSPWLITEEDRRHFALMRNPQYALEQYEKGVLEWTSDMCWRKENRYIRWQRSVYSIVENGYTGALYLYCYLYDVLDEKVMQSLFSGIKKHIYLKTAVLCLRTGQIYDYVGDLNNYKLMITDYEVSRAKYMEDEVLPEDVEQVMKENTLSNIIEQLRLNEHGFAFIHRKMVHGTLQYHQVRYAMVPETPDLCICVVRDVTSLVEDKEQANADLKKALLQAQSAAQAKSEFLSRMSHEIRTPMNAIIGMTAIAMDSKSDYIQVSDCLNRIESSGNYLLTLIDDILEMNRIENGKAMLSKTRFDFADLVDTIRTVVEPLAQKSEIRLKITNRTGNGIYYGDHIRIQQVIINLLSNAIKFTKKSGRVRFDLSRLQETDTITVFEFFIEDTGIGMSEEFMERMFEPFTQEDSTTTSQYSGSGLGLAISKNLVEAMGGKITAESMVGFGTNFTVDIPLEKVQKPIQKKSSNTESLSIEDVDNILRNKYILMAEDHPMNVMVAKRLLERKGMLVTVAENGRIAVDIFHHSAPDEYDAILMDIRMPEMDGLEATRQIRSLERSDAKAIPIIAMTANVLEEDREHSKDAGMNDHLAKTVDPQKMYQTLAEQIVRRK